MYIVFSANQLKTQNSLLFCIFQNLISFKIYVSPLTRIETLRVRILIWFRITNIKFFLGPIVVWKSVCYKPITQCYQFI